MESRVSQGQLERHLKTLDAIKSVIPDDRAALVILQEMNKDARMSEIRKEREVQRYEPATEKQVNFLNKLGVDIPENLTKIRASALIDEELAKEAR